MNEYKVTYVRYYTYTVMANNEDEAEYDAHEMFNADMRCPIATADYDDIEIECVK